MAAPLTAEASASEEAPGTETAGQPPRAEGEERRERRSRDRYGRDRRERNGERTGDRERTGRDGAGEPDGVVDMGEAREPATRSYFDRPSSPAAAPEMVEREAPVVAAAATAPAAPDLAPVPPAGDSTPPAPTRALPTVQSFTLPVDELAQIAESAGLLWVNSDPSKIADAQAAIAAEPAPIHVPRERPALVIADEGPLVLVETRKDLRNLNLPF